SSSSPPHLTEPTPEKPPAPRACYVCMCSIRWRQDPTGEPAMNSFDPAKTALADVSGREVPVSVHRFRFWGALGRTALLLFGGLIALVIGLGCLGGCVVALERSALEAALWGLLGLCGFIACPAAVYEALRLFIQPP